MPASTFSALLADQLRRDAARPLVTFYDDHTGERVELSVATYANWVAKTANLAQEELELSRGDLLLVDLPTHWQGPIWLGAAWSLGLTVTDRVEDLSSAAAVVCGPDGVGRYSAVDVPVVAHSLRPLGARFADPLPSGVTDYGAEVLAQPDLFMAYDAPGPDDAAWRDDQGTLTQAALAATPDEPGGPQPDRLLTDVNPCTREGLASLLGPLGGGGGTVWVANPDAAQWSARAAAERASRTLRAQPQRD